MQETECLIPCDADRELNVMLSPAANEAICAEGSLERPTSIPDLRRTPFGELSEHSLLPPCDAGCGNSLSRRTL